MSTCIKDGGLDKEAAIVKEAYQQDQRKLEDANFSNGEKYQDKDQENYQVLGKIEPKRSFNPQKMKQKMKG